MALASTSLVFDPFKKCVRVTGVHIRVDDRNLAVCTCRSKIRYLDITEFPILDM